MDFKNLITKYKNNILNIAIIILALILAINIYKRQARLIASLVERKNSAIKKNEVLMDIEQLEKKFISYKSVINNKDISSVINTLTNIAGDSAINIISLKPQKQEERPDYVRYPFNLTVESPDYHSLARFIAKIENSTDIYIIENISISKVKEAGKKSPLTTELKLSTILVK